MKREISIQISIIKPMPMVVYALQSGSGKIFENVHGQFAKDDDLVFEGRIEIKAADLNDEAPDFKGSLVQGPKLSRFIYIGIGKYAGQPDAPWARRLKIPLSGITWDTIMQVETDPQLVLATTVPGIGKDGGPNCATVKPFAGWSVKKNG